jgi:hypothetical protein
LWFRERLRQPIGCRHIISSWLARQIIWNTSDQNFVSWGNWAPLLWLQHLEASPVFLQTNTNIKWNITHYWQLR